MCRFVCGEMAEYVWWCDARRKPVCFLAADGDGWVVIGGGSEESGGWDFGIECFLGEWRRRRGPTRGLIWEANRGVWILIVRIRGRTGFIER